jgi:alkylhydroperoxidase family enzyme
VANAPAASVEILNAVQKAWGFVPVLAESPAALEAYSSLWGIAEKTSFTAQERNVAYLAIIYENECTYCMAGHTNLSRMAKRFRSPVGQIFSHPNIIQIIQPFTAVGRVR